MSKDPLGMRFTLKSFFADDHLTILHVCFARLCKDEFKREMVPDDYYFRFSRSAYR